MFAFNNQSRFLSLLALSSALFVNSLLVTACSFSNFTARDEISKLELLNAQSILLNPIEKKQKTSKLGGETDPQPTPSETPSPTPPTAEIKIPVSSFCSTGTSKMNDGVNLKSASLIKVEVKMNDPKNNSGPSVVCTLNDKTEITQNILTNTGKNRMINLSSCQLKDGAYTLSISASVDSAESQAKYKPIGIISYGNFQSAYPFSVKDSKFLGSGLLSVLVEYNDQFGKPGVNGFKNSEEECDTKTSPLAIQTNNNSFLSFSKGSQSILFDILGSNPSKLFSIAPYTKVKIPWIEQADFMFIVKPNAQEKVEGIDQLFGDNTLGPDGLTSKNGFEALAKYDGNSLDGKRVSYADGFITNEDPIFESLRLWSDANLDGLVQSNELHLLSEFFIVSLDLKFDPNFSEIDSYGNEIKYKSVAKKESGDLMVMFDIWFDLKHLSK